MPPTVDESAPADEAVAKAELVNSGSVPEPMRYPVSRKYRVKLPGCKVRV